MVKKLYICKVYNLEKLEKFLEEQANKGLMFTGKKGPFCYFEECEPRKLKFIIENTSSDCDAYYEISGWKECGKYGSARVLFSEDINEEPAREVVERRKSVKEAAMAFEEIKWIIGILTIGILTLIKISGMSLAEFLVKDFYFLMAIIAGIILIVVDIIRCVFSNARKCVMVCIFEKCALFVCLVVFVFLEFIINIGYESNMKPRFVCEQFSVLIDSGANHKVQGEAFESPVGMVHRWNEIYNDENGNEICAIEYQIIKIKNDYLIDRFVEKENNGYEDVTERKVGLWRSEKVFYNYEENVEKWLVQYEDIAFKVEIKGKVLNGINIQYLEYTVEKYYGPGSEIEEGVYYSKAHKTDVEQVSYEGFVIDGMGTSRKINSKLVNFEDKMYTTTYEGRERDKSKLKMEGYIDKEIGKVYGQWGRYGRYYSQDKTEIEDATIEATVYKLKDYDENFRIGIYFKETLKIDEGKTYHYFYVCDCLNGIVLVDGSDLYDDRLHIDEAKTINCWNGNGGMHIAGPETEFIRDFIKAVNEGYFVETKENTSEFWEENYPLSVSISFIDDYGVEQMVIVYDDGYVITSQKGTKNFILKVDEQKCKNVIEYINSIKK